MGRYLLFPGVSGKHLFLLRTVDGTVFLEPKNAYQWREWTGETIPQGCTRAGNPAREHLFGMVRGGTVVRPFPTAPPFEDLCNRQPQLRRRPAIFRLRG